MRSLSPELRELLFDGTVIPAHPLALDENRMLDKRRQRALTRYYMDAGAGGVAVGVHTTQFEIRDKAFGLLEPVLTLAAETVAEANLTRPFLKVAGIVGPTAQAVKEAELAASLGYDLGLLSNGGLGDWTDEALLERTKEVAAILPVFGFYLQPSVGGRALSYGFWRAFADLPRVMAVKIAPFDRYQTIDVVRAVCESARQGEIALYTGNDDNIILDLLTPYCFDVDGKRVEKRIVGGLLGQWAVWTRKAVELLEAVKLLRGLDTVPVELLTRNIELTDANAVIFDSANSFHGCIPGIHEVLRRQGLLEGTWCLNQEERLSAGQEDEIERIYRAYPHLNDDAFVGENLERWLEN